MQKNNYKYAVFILTHGRPDNVITYRTLKNSGYTGDIYMIVDNEDKEIENYKKKFDNVVIFDKKKYGEKFDIMDNFDGRNVIVFARNACYDIARELGLDYFFEYEDDYTSFSIRHIDKSGSLRGNVLRDLDSVFDIMINALVWTKSDTLAFAQGGDFIGGAGSFKNNTYKRKAMNTFVFKVNQDPKDDILFLGRMNDDVNMYLTQGMIGKKIFQNAYISMVQVQTQKNSGGNTEAYKKYGTYVKSFYSVMACPSCCKISLMGREDMRIHHRIDWARAVPKILSLQYKKTSDNLRNLGD